MLDTNLRGSFFMSQALARHMATRGRIRQLTMTFADAFGPQGITVNCLAPDWFHAAENDVLYRREEWVNSIVARMPLRRPGGANDLDGASVFPAGDASGFITGQTRLVDGGFMTSTVPGDAWTGLKQTSAPGHRCAALTSFYNFHMLATADPMHVFDSTDI